jgi:hypothetical protein
VEENSDAVPDSSEATLGMTSTGAFTLDWSDMTISPGSGTQRNNVGGRLQRRGPMRRPPQRRLPLRMGRCPADQRLGTHHSRHRRAANRRAPEPSRASPLCRPAAAQAGSSLTASPDSPQRNDRAQANREFSPLHRGQRPWSHGERDRPIDPNLLYADRAIHPERAFALSFQWMLSPDENGPVPTCAACQVALP